MSYGKHTASLQFLFEGNNAYLIKSGQRYRLKSGFVIANGTRDLCIVKTSEGSLKLMKTEDSNPEDILLIPKHDIAHLEFDEEIPEYGTIMIFDISESVVSTIAEMLRRFPSSKKMHYDAYLGREYV